MTIAETRRVTATELARNLSALLGEIRYRRIDLEVTKGDEVIARVLPPEARPAGCSVDRLDGLFRRLPRLEPHEAEAFASDVREARKALAESESPWDS